MRFPESFGDFTRERVMQHDSIGKNVGIGYNREQPGRQLAATVYVYPLPERTFEHELAEVKGAHAGAEVAFRQPLALEQSGQKIECQRAGLSWQQVFAHEYGPVSSYLLVCDKPAWRIKWRFTHRAGTDQSVVADMRGLAAALTLQR